jgi:hypothetical protein
MRSALGSRGSRLLITKSTDARKFWNRSTVLLIWLVYLALSCPVSWLTLTLNYILKRRNARPVATHQSSTAICTYFRLVANRPWALLGNVGPLTKTIRSRLKSSAEMFCSFSYFNTNTRPLFIVVCIKFHKNP